jgi:adenosylcobyric acid synthase
MTPARCLMVQGTASGVGKSLLVAALCRIFARRGYRVAPFKSQNMALNSAVTLDGREIGRAQAAQADAAGVEATADMNPILLKPEGEDRSQVIVRGAPIGSMTFREYGRLRGSLMGVVEDSLTRLRQAHDLIVIEGAGSPAEINLSEGEIVNMRIARLADAPVLLAGDIDRGGLLAAFVGTLELLELNDRARVAGFLVNKFRGNPELLAPGLEALTARTGVPVLGVVPYLEPALMPAEDSLDLDAAAPALPGPAGLEVAVVRLPRIANFDDFEPLAREPGVRVRFVHTPIEIAASDLIVVPGSKSTMADLAWLREAGLAAAITAGAARGVPVIGICGGYQMLGAALRDPERVESMSAAADGLGLLDVVTTFTSRKTTIRVQARVAAPRGLLAAAAGIELGAYEIHVGRSEVAGATRPFVLLERGGSPAGEPEGAMNATGTVVGTYLHGLFASGELRRALLTGLAARRGLLPDPRWGTLEPASARYDRLADLVAPAVDVPAIAKLAGL